MLNRYWLRFDIEVPARDLQQAIERALRLFRPRVRDGMRMRGQYHGAYRGSWFAMQTISASVREDRVDLVKAQKHRKLRRRKRRTSKKGAKRSTRRTRRSRGG